MESPEEVHEELTKALRYYMQAYEEGRSWLLSPSHKRSFLGDRSFPRRCRFCGEAEPKVSFKKDAHAVPEMLGNKTLFVYYECDDCNQRFGDTLENHLGSYTKPLRTLFMTKGKKGVPTLKAEGARWEIRYEKDVLNFIHDEGDPDFVLDEIAKTWTVRLPRESYIPLLVLKAITKIGLMLIPEDKIALFSDALRWVSDVDGNDAMFESHGFGLQFAPGPSGSTSMMVSLLFRRNDYIEAPFCHFMLTFGCFNLQYYIPSRQKDWYIYGKKRSVPFFPMQDAEYVLKYGWVNRSSPDMSSSEPVRNGAFEMIMSYQDRAKI